MRGRLFVFSGIDGSGKSTQINRLAQLLADSDQKPLVFWARGGYTSGMNLAKVLLRRVSKRGLVPPAGHNDRRRHAFANPLIRKTWLTLAILDLIRVYAVGLRWRLLRGRTVLCDRYCGDTLLDFQLNFPDEQVEHWWLWRLLVRLCPHPDAAFLLLVPISVSRQRSADKQEPFPTPDDVLTSRLAAYRTWKASDDMWYVLDGECPVAQITHEIATVISAHCAEFQLDPQNVPKVC